MQAPPDPFLTEAQLELQRRTREFAEEHLRAGVEGDDPTGRTRRIVAQMGRDSLLEAAVPSAHGELSLGAMVAVREVLAYYSALADTAFASQGLGSYPLVLAGSEAQRERWLPAVVHGDVLCAFAVSEPEAGSDLAAVRSVAQSDGELWRLSGVKTFISNAGLAGLYTVLARSSDAPGHKGLSTFLVDAEAPGITIKPQALLAPHPVGEVRFDETPALLLGEPGRGLKITLATLETYRPGVGAAACGLAARALDEALRWSLARRQFGRSLAEFQLTQGALAEMQTELQAARLLVRQAAWLRDRGVEGGRYGAAAKLFATECAQRVVDRALQIHGGTGVLKGSTVERLYREVRALRIYEGTSEMHKLAIAREMLNASR